ncbi:MAG: hypothetical protein LBO68_05100 [Synergistaceae bacterium]|jgi:hypothetical protein|nr:hypothetical protein [Synergistaceae bacterium]
MRRLWKSVCVVCLILGSVSFRADAAFLPVTGMFEEVEQTDGGWLITLLVEEQRASGLLSPECTYEIDGNEIDREFFFKDALHQKITVELDEKSSNVIRCRLEIPQFK